MKHIFPPTVPQHVVHRWKALCENLPAGRVKIKLGQSSQIRHLHYTDFECRPIRDTSTHSHGIELALQLAEKMTRGNNFAPSRHCCFLSRNGMTTRFSAEYLQIGEFASRRSMGIK